ncbi:pimeloyl-ACP methyl ester carboxylesterase [Granulicella aggregans]|uniref:Pimeloyl-ACP methyl ester carboxylesterase n=1 Tax=Granulicella aggregans TaxID=474949 RepID=A0A7W7ZJL6_9BACT|nr:alpha/beta hydrolase [Granulicella aggregans]MBB5061120.1 pimeloyl-ACP methyl ester carboxylesterase [Granulicella aggregans]
MSEVISAERATGSRRRFLSRAALALACAALPIEEEAIGQAKPSGPFRSIVTSAAFPPVKQIYAGSLDIGYIDLGPPDGPVVVLLHGWPYDIHSFVDVTEILAKSNYRVIVPHLRGYGSTRFLSAETMRNAQPVTFALDVIALMDALHITQAVIGGFDWGARTADIVAALWPERCKGLVSVSGYLIGNQKAGKTPLPPVAELAWWYQFYFATERGRDGYDKYRREFAKLIWQTASPRWQFDDAMFERSASSFDNPDHTSIVVHNYRWRLGIALGESKYDALEQTLASAPRITVPTITLEGDANGAPHPDSNDYAKMFAGKYVHRLVKGGVGHNLPMEAPDAFAKAIQDVSSL